jgi:signal transduction histidine kinase
MATVGRPVVWLVIVGTGTVLALVPRTHENLTTYASASPGLAAADVSAALALLGACVLGLLVDPGRPGLVALGLASLTWSLEDWAGWYEGPGFAPTVGLVVAPMLVPFLVHAALSAAGKQRRMRKPLVVLYVGAGTVAFIYALFYDPFLDENCWSACTTRNVLVVAARPDLVERVATTWLLMTALTGLALAGLAIRAAVVASAAARRVRGPALVAGTVLGAVLMTQSLERWRQPRVNPDTSLDDVLYGAVVVAVTLVAAAWAYGPLLDRWTRRGVAHLVNGLGSAAAAGTVARVIAAATGDPSVRVVYRLPSSGGYADAVGRPVAAPEPGPGALPVLRDDLEVAVVVHDPEASSSDAVRSTFGTALMLALDNERLRSEGLAQLADLRASRARVVETGDAERRQLERNLHDGAQQRMLALSFDLRRAVAGAKAAETRDVLVCAEAEARAALAELRDLAHGIHPAVLDEAGLAPALATLAYSAPVPVEVCDGLGARLPPSVERTAYVVVRDAVANAATKGSRGVSVTLTQVDGDLVVEVLGAGAGPLVSVQDRVAGAGGHVVVESERLRAVIPCVS